MTTITVKEQKSREETEKGLQLVKNFALNYLSKLWSVFQHLLLMCGQQADEIITLFKTGKNRLTL
jgi:hypothetical protein